uniref:Uncharacterized protein n=1 Tax=Anguilla anguilla TaxID=7936 RepID=A0A0E9W2I2_ANGAN
MFDGRGCY